MVSLDNKNPSESQLEEILRRTGFPTELEVALTLERMKWFVTNSAYFFDIDKRKDREVDILAFREPPDPRSYASESFGFYPSLICECKKSTKYDWVFFSRTSRPYVLEGESVHGMLSPEGRYLTHRD